MLLLQRKFAPLSLPLVVLFQPKAITFQMRRERRRIRFIGKTKFIHKVS